MTIWPTHADSHLAIEVLNDVLLIHVCNKWKASCILHEYNDTAWWPHWFVLHCVWRAFISHKRHIQFKPNFKSSTKYLFASAAEKQPCVDISQGKIGSKYIYYPASKKKITRTILWCDTELAGTSTVTIGCIHGIAGVVDEDSQDTEFCPVFARAKQKNKHMFVKARGMSEDLPLLVIYLLQR